MSACVPACVCIAVCLYASMLTLHKQERAFDKYIIKRIF